MSPMVDNSAFAYRCGFHVVSCRRTPYMHHLRAMHVLEATYPATTRLGRQWLPAITHMAPCDLQLQSTAISKPSS